MRRSAGGAESQIRTGDTAIFSRVLYQLSYLGPFPGPPKRARRRGAEYHGPRTSDKASHARLSVREHAPRPSPTPSAGRVPAAGPGGRTGSPDRQGWPTPGRGPGCGSSIGGWPCSERSRLIRSMTGGWVENRFDCLPDTPLIGFSKYRCWVARLATSSGSWSSAIFASACSRPSRVPGQLDARRVGEVLALAADRQLDEPGEDRARGWPARSRPRRRRSAARHRRCSESLRATAGAAAPEREPQEEVGQERDRPDQHADHQREPDVEVPDVRQLVGHDALELLAIELLEQARRDRDRRVLRVATGGERVGRRVVDEVDLRDRHVRRERHLLHDVVQLRHGLGIDLLGARDPEHDRVAGVVREQRRDQPEDDGDGERRERRPRVPGDGPADEQPEGAQQDDDGRGEQDRVALVGADLLIERAGHGRQVIGTANGAVWLAAGVS